MMPPLLVLVRFGRDGEKRLWLPVFLLAPLVWLLWFLGTMVFVLAGPSERDRLPLCLLVLVSLHCLAGLQVEVRGSGRHFGFEFI